MHLFNWRPTALRGLRAAPLALVALLLLGALPGAAGAQSVRVTTNMGAFVIELDAERAPLTVANFLRYVNEGFYTNTLFHRVVGNFVIQGGGHNAGDYKLKPTHEAIVNESGNGLANVRGTVGIARSGPPHSANSQFYINLVDNPELNPLPTRWGYAVFGKVTEGMEVIEKIGVIATGAVGPFKSEAPLKDVVIEKIELIKEGTPAAPASEVKPEAPASEAPPPAGTPETHPPASGTSSPGSETAPPASDPAASGAESPSPGTSAPASETPPPAGEGAAPPSGTPPQ